MLRAKGAQSVSRYAPSTPAPGSPARSGRWPGTVGVPLVAAIRAMAKVTNDTLAEGDTPEPDSRMIGEEQMVEAADM